MALERWHDLKELFTKARELAGDERAAFLVQVQQANPELGQRLAALLDSARVEGPLDAPTPQPEEPAATGVRIGPYRVLRALGHGATSVVYLATRDDHMFDKNVAVKVIHRALLSPELASRLKRERQILAVLEHANIARLLDAGVTDDQHAFIVMEYVDGVPIDEFCGLVKLSTEGILKLFIQVTHAVSYAHQRLVVHRDLKPANILVSRDGVPKLLDFGIATILDASAEKLTVTGFQRFTPEFASPEQFEGKPISTATDVYSLGVILYQLLTGALPYSTRSRLPHEIAKAVLEDEPAAPRSHSNAIERDLEAILLMALRKEPEQRYHSVSDLRADLERYLGGYPVHAQAPSRLQKVRKFVLRNKRAVLAGTLAVALLTVSQIRFIQEKRRADRRSLEMQEVAGKVMSDTQGYLFNTYGATEANSHINEIRVRFLDSLLVDSPNDLKIKRDLLDALFLSATSYGDSENLHLGKATKSLETFRRALRISQEFHQNSPTDPLNIMSLAHALNYMGKAYREQLDLQNARTCFRQAIELLTPYEKSQAVGEAAKALPFSLSLLALTEAELGNADEAFTEVDRILRLRQERLAAATSWHVYAARRALSINYWHLARANLALRRYDEAADFAAKGVTSEETARTIDSASSSIDLYLARHLVTLSLSETGRGRGRAGFSHSDRAAGLYERLRDKDHKTTSLTREHGLALAARASAQILMGKREDALVSLRKQHDLYRWYREAGGEETPSSKAELAVCEQRIVELVKQR